VTAAIASAATPLHPVRRRHTRDDGQQGRSFVCARARAFRSAWRLHRREGEKKTANHRPPMLGNESRDNRRQSA
jgi:hypothetical protein